MRDAGQVFIFNDAELSLIKATFGDNEALLYTVRKVLLQFPLTDAERGLIKMSITEPVWAVLKKRMLPELGEEFPLGQLSSLLTTLTDQLKVKSVEEMAPLFAAKQLEIAYLNQQFEILKDIDLYVSQPINLYDLSVIKNRAAQDVYINLQAYLFILGYVDPMLGMIRNIAGVKEETVEQAKERMKRDSSK